MRRRPSVDVRKLFAYLQIAAGTLIGALAVNLFMVPNQLPSGGLSGLMLILHYLWNAPIGVGYFLFNLPALFWLQRLYGWRGMSKTVWGMVTFSLFVQVTAPLSAYAPTENLLLASLYGGAMLGAGLGLANKAGGATGGTDAIGKIVHHYYGLNLAKFLLWTDFAILGFGAVVMPVESILYGLLMTFVITQAVKVVLEGLSTSRCVLIISEQPDAVSASIMTELKRGLTRLGATGEYTGKARPVLMCVVSEKEITRLKRLIQAADPEAFVLITDAREVSGRGFTLETDVRRASFWASMGAD